ncbi:hypothetical protein SISSUDRAFT_1061023 [Sistotremastrum suecicum HHB10207 ss-3]|uniref:Protein kinase domain-containing protein n=1 Tax=Sistotremastrum suecicum HHB10207 ss-3 TaxID=1314776 RepID=A0A166EFF5_9AGAM|nr:hypothetical protein SISSUDRAFT_1061023 [Sistotremastrum suecicum HHB10207 ss-3]
MSVPANDVDIRLLLPDISTLKDLTDVEKRWAGYHGWLKSLGYELRSRYRHDWSPSWLKTGYKITHSEDAIQPTIGGKIMDATRMSDGKIICMKLVPTHTKELVIWQFLSSPDLRKDSRNHCIPIFDIHPLPDTDEQVLVVMPLLVVYDIIPFETPGEVMYCVHSFLEGLVFMHEHNVAHLDVASVNVMMEPGPSLFPKGFHPVDPLCYVPNPSSPKIRAGAPHISRTLSPVTYYHIDFGESIKFDDFEHRERIYGRVGHARDAPEFRTGRSYDPFQLDIRACGDMIKEIPELFCGLEALQPLIDAMRRDEPDERPTAVEALALLKSVIVKHDPDFLRSFLKPNVDFFETISLREYRSHQLDIRILGRPPIYPEIPDLKFEAPKPPRRISQIVQRLLIWVT